MILIDYSQFCRAAMYASKMENEADGPFMKYIIIKTLMSMNTKFRDKFGKLVICCDGRNYWRKEVFPPYKQKRREAQQESKMNEALFFEIKNELMNELGDNTPWHVVQIDRMEADDLIGTSARVFDEPNVVISSDHDFKQLQMFDNVSQYCPRSHKFIEESNPDFYRFHHVMKGDAGDGIPNVLSDRDTFITEKRQKPVAQKDINYLFGSLINDGPEGFVSPVEIKVTPEIREWLNKKGGSEERFYENLRLVDLTSLDKEVYVDCENGIRETLEEQERKYKGSSQLMTYLSKNKMPSLLDNLNDFGDSHPGALI